MSQAKQYMADLLSHVRPFEKINDVLKASQSKIASSVRKGKIQVSEHSDNIEDLLYNNSHIEPTDRNLSQLEIQIKQKKNRLLVQLEELHNQDINEEKIKLIKRQLAQLRREQTYAAKNREEDIKKNYIEKMKKWNEQHKELKYKRSMQQQNQFVKSKDKDQRAKKEEEDIKIFMKIEKQKKLQKKIKAIEEQRQKRLEIIKSASQFMNNLNMPKYLQIEKKYREAENERRFEEQIARKNKKLEMKIDTEQIKKHEEEYMQRVKARHKSMQSLLPKIDNNNKNSQHFNIMTNRNEQQMKEQLQKLKRRRQFQQKIKQIPIKIDQSKKMEVQIHKDKSNNPFKYNFLSQKALNDMQIFGQFQQFQMNANPRQLGKNYLSQLRSLPKQSRVMKSSSIQQMQSQTQRPAYKDYLSQMKATRVRPVQSQDEVENIKKLKNRDKAHSLLNKKSQGYLDTAKLKMEELKKIGNIKEVVKKQNEVDTALLKAVRAKLAALEISD